MKEHFKTVILVVEDERPLLDLISDKLSSRGYEVVSATRTGAAMNFMQDGIIPSIIWLDHYLSEETALDFVAWLKMHEEWKKIPVFLVSNTASDQKVRSYLKLGVEKYYTKSNVRIDSIISDIEVSLESAE